jgi:hypothetical protein
VDGRVVLERLIRLGATLGRTAGEVCEEFYDRASRGHFHVQDDAGNIVSSSVLGYMGEYGFNGDGSFIVHPVKQKVPVRPVSWREINQLFPEPASVDLRILDGVGPILRDYLVYTYPARSRGSWPTESEDYAWGKARGLGRTEMRELRRFTRPPELKRKKKSPK